MSKLQSLYGLKCPPSPPHLPLRPSSPPPPSTRPRRVEHGIADGGYVTGHRRSRHRQERCPAPPAQTSRSADLRVLDGPDDDIAHGLETFVQQAQGDALAGAWIACDHDVAAVGDAGSTRRRNASRVGVVKRASTGTSGRNGLNFRP